MTERAKYWAVIAACLFVIAGVLAILVPAHAQGQPKTTICHPVAAATGGNTHAGYSIITTANPSVHIDEATGAPKHNFDGRVDFIVTDDAPCPPPSEKPKWDPQASLIGPCGDPFYGYVLDNSGSDVPAQFTITYFGVVGHHVYDWVNRNIVVEAGDVFTSGSTKADYVHVKAGTELTIVASQDGFPTVPLVDITTAKSGRVDCPWQ